MTVAVKNNAPVVLPDSALRRAGFKRGQELEIRASGGVITVIPKLPSADEEYTPAQRRIIDARLAKADEDIKAGRVYGPFTAKQATEFIKGLSKERASKRKPRARR